MLIVSVALLTGAHAEAKYVPHGPWHQPWESWCSKNYRSENYGLGLGAGYLGEEPAPASTVDAMCMRLGRDAGKKLAADQASNQPWCQEAFEASLADGKQAAVQVVGSPSECSNAGYAYGVALLENAMRRGLVEVAGAECIAQYQEGKRLAAQHLAPSYTGDNLLDHCLATGNDDGSLFGQ
ncbi:MAG TPA: hypothetical protein VL588_11670 [Bdellovibrionota bacterium]|nr:hypothetical protein [Bdellovibrionota bacterium]